MRLAEEAESLFRGREFSIPSADVLNLAAKSNCSAYDCEFVVLAQDLKVPLVTTDQKLARKFPEVAVTLKNFLKIG